MPDTIDCLLIYGADAHPIAHELRRGDGRTIGFILDNPGGGDPLGAVVNGEGAWYVNAGESVEKLAEEIEGWLVEPESSAAP